MNELVVGTRGSALALAQTDIVCRALARAHPGVTVRVQRITTTGDERADVPLAQLGRGVFVTEIEAALRDRRIDFAVHSAKDLPSTLASDLAIAAFLPRADARDVLVSRSGTLRNLPRGARVGTSSPRRACLLRAIRPDLQPLDIRGNVDTRLRKLASGDFDAIVLAAAGLIRLGREREITEWLEPDVMMPSVGQGALAVETRADDAATLSLLRHLDDRVTRVAVNAERAFLAELGAGCRAAAAAHATVAGDQLHVQAIIGAADGRHVKGARVVAVAEAEQAGADLARELLSHGGAAFLAGDGQALAGQRVVLTRTAEQSRDLSSLLQAHGADVRVCSTIAIEPVQDDLALDAALRTIDRCDWLVFTSANAVGPTVERLSALGVSLPARLRLAVVGQATARAVSDAFGAAAFTPSRSDAESLANELPVRAGDVVLFPRGDIAREVLPARLRERGATVHDVVAYRTVPGECAGELATCVRDGTVDVIVFASPSSVRFAVGLPAAMHQASHPPAVVAIGATTAAALRDAGVEAALEAATATVGGIVEAVLRAVTRRQTATELSTR